MSDESPAPCLGHFGMSISVSGRCDSKISVLVPGAGASDLRFIMRAPGGLIRKAW